MITRKTRARLLRHAALDEPGTARGPSIAWSVWPEGRSRKGIDEALRDGLGALAALNRELNFPPGRQLDLPPGPGAPEPASDLPRDVVYSVTETLRMIRDARRDAADPEVARILDRAAWRFETAWCAVLAGDIEDLEEHVREEEGARFDD